MKVRKYKSKELEYHDITVHLTEHKLPPDPNQAWSAEWNDGYKCYAPTWEKAYEYAKEWIGHFERKEAKA